MKLNPSVSLSKMIQAITRSRIPTFLPRSPSFSALALSWIKEGHQYFWTINLDTFSFHPSTLNYKIHCLDFLRGQELSDSYLTPYSEHCNQYLLFPMIAVLVIGFLHDGWVNPVWELHSNSPNYFEGLFYNAHLSHKWMITTFPW